MVFRLEEVVLIVVIEQWKERRAERGTMVTITVVRVNLRRWHLLLNVSNNVDSELPQWAAVDAGIPTFKLGNNEWHRQCRTGSGTYHNDYICALVANTRLLGLVHVIFSQCLVFSLIFGGRRFWKH